jgi:arginyl-tRNA synthetase
MTGAGALTQRGLDAGVFQRWHDGSVVFDTGRSEYRLVPLVRKDGFPTEHLRALVLWGGEADVLDDATTIVHVMGDEWLLATEQREHLLDRLGVGGFLRRYRKLAYGMVEHDGSQMKSSTGDVILVDRYLDRILQEPAFVDRFGALPAEPRRRMSLIVGLAYFLGVPAPKPLTFGWTRVWSAEHNPGWGIATALAQAERERGDRGDDDADTRFALLQAQRFRGLLARAQTELEPPVLLKYAEHVARWYQQQPRSAACAGVVAAVLDAAVRALGLDGAAHA